MLNVSSKRKRPPQGSDSDDEEPTMGRQILPVANLPQDFSGEPVDGLQYLFTVRRDARALPRTTKVTNPFELTARRAASVEDTLHPELPSETWRGPFGEHFCNFRQNIIQPTIEFRHAPEEQLSDILPEKKERDKWWAFVSGQPKTEWKGKTVTKKGEQTPAAQTFRIGASGEVEPVPDVPNIPFNGTNTAKTRVPTPSLARRIDNRLALHVLMYFTHWINLYLTAPSPSSPFRICDPHAHWMLVLLARVEPHLSGDDLSLLRQLARACLNLIKSVRQRPGAMGGEEAIRIRSCWMVFYAVVDFWGQRDLVADAQAMLTGSDGRP